MSDARTKIERSRTKDLRQGVTEQKTITGNKKKKGNKDFGFIDTWKFFNKTFESKRYFPNEKARDQAMQAAIKRGRNVKIIESNNDETPQTHSDH